MGGAHGFGWIFMVDYTNEDLREALEALASMMARSEKAQAKFAPGTSQHTLQKNRIGALLVASRLVGAEPAGQEAAGECTKEELENAAAPLASLLSKSEKAQQKLAPGSWQHRMLEENLRALRIASSLLEKALSKA